MKDAKVDFPTELLRELSSMNTHQLRVQVFELTGMDAYSRMPLST